MGGCEGREGVCGWVRGLCVRGVRRVRGVRVRGGVWGWVGVCEGSVSSVYAYMHLARLLLALVLEDDVFAVGHPLS